MAKTQSTKKKVITTKTSEKKGVKTVSTSPKYKVKKTGRSKAVELPFGKKNFQLVILGAVLILLGMILMSGGSMPSPDVWDESRIYSFRRITLAPIVIILGLIIEIIAIFRDK